MGTSQGHAFPEDDDLTELGDDEFDFEDFSRKVRRVPELAEALDRMWPRLSPHELLHDLFGAPPLIAAAARGILSAEEQALLRRPRSASFDDVAWTPADAALVDEARHLLGPRSGGSDDSVRKYGHIVVDEVQDLSPMQLRMLTRRSLSGSMTVVGDIAQATAPWAPTSWEDIVEHLPNRRPSRTAELTVSYRTPAEVLAVAARVLAVAAPGLTPPRPVRRSGVDPTLLVVRSATGDPTLDDLARTVAEAAAAEVDAVRPGRVAIIAPEQLLSALTTALDAADVPVVDARDLRKGGLSEPLVLLAADSANGLEFDSVVVVEPDDDRRRDLPRPPDALRRAHPPHPAAHGGLADPSPRRPRRLRLKAPPWPADGRPDPRMRPRRTPGRDPFGRPAELALRAPHGVKLAP